MAITMNPKRHPIASVDTQAEAFISGAGKSDVKDEAEDAGRKPIVVRFPSDLLKRIDVAAKRRSLSRSAFIVSTMADLVNED